MPFRRRLLFYVLACGFLTSLAVAQPGSSLDKGIALYQREQDDEAASMLKKARGEDPPSTRAAYYLGLVYKRLQNYTEAKVHLNDAVTGSPKIKEALIELVEVLYQLGETDEAFKWIVVAEETGVRPAQTAFLKGLVSAKAGKNPEAIEAFKNARDLDKALTQSADYQIGLIHLKDKSWDEAEKTFQEVVIVDPNSDIAAFANEYMKAMQRRQETEKPFRLQAGVYFEYDDNVILKPGDVTTVGDIGNEEDTREVVTANAEWAHRFSDRWGVRLQYDLYFANQTSLDAFDLHSHTWGFVPVYQPASQNWTVSMPLQYNHTWVDRGGFLSSETINPLVNFKITERQTGQIGVKLQLKDYLRASVNDNEDRDAFRAAPGVSWLMLFWDNKAILNLRYELDAEDTDGRNWDYFGHRFTASVRVPFFLDKLYLTLAGDVYLQDFENMHSTFNVEREDEAYTASTQFSYDLTRNFQLQLRYTYVDHDSNIAIYKYGRNVISGGVLSKF